MKSALLRACAVVLLVAFVAACSGPSVREKPPAATPEEAARPELKLATAGGLPEVGRRLADLLRGRFPDAQWGRMALAWDGRYAWLRPLGKGFSGNWPNCVLAADLGLSGSRVEEISVQLDPSNFREVLWLRPDLDSSGALAGVSVELKSLGVGPAFSASIPCDPPLPLSQPVGKIHGTALTPAWLALGETPAALAWEAGTARLWIASKGKISRVDYASKKSVQEWNLPPSQATTDQERAVLSDLSEESTSSVGWFDLDRGQGRLYVKGAGDLFEPAQAIDGYPLAERVQRFVKAPYDTQEHVFAVQDFKGTELAHAASIARFLGPGGSHFGLLGPEGGVRVLRGGDLIVLNGPSPSPASAIAGFGGILLVASSQPPYDVKGYRLSGRGSWEEVWRSPVLPAAAAALCAGEPGTRSTLFAGLPAAGGGEIYAIPLEAQARP